MTLAQIKVEIEVHRRQAKRLRKQADKHDLLADELRKEAAKQQTAELDFSIRDNPTGS